MFSEITSKMFMKNTKIQIENSELNILYLKILKSSRGFETVLIRKNTKMLKIGHNVGRQKFDDTAENEP
jgi:hypothetical protein